MSELRVLSLGAGVQSTALLLMALRGEFGPPPDVAIFADTGWEPRAVYEHLEWLESEVAPFPIHRVSIGNIRADALNPRKRFASMPLYTMPLAGGSEGKARRQCTREYKVAPVTLHVRRELLGLKPRQRIGKNVRVEMWMGISLDEVVRMKPNRERWITNRWPLVERSMTRADCLQWLSSNGYPQPPKSACIGCPYTDDARWREMQTQSPDEFADAAAFDAAIRDGHRRFTQDAYLHRSLLPLADVEFGRWRSQRLEIAGQEAIDFSGECEGMCGT